MRPSHLPKLRDQTVRFLDDPQSALRAKAPEDVQSGLDVLGRHLRAAGLYWVAPDMAALAMSAGEQLAAARWAAADRPSSCGLVFFDGGVGAVDAHGVSIPVEACTWGPHEGGCMIWLLMSRRYLAGEMARIRMELVEEELPPFIPISGFTVPVTAEPVPLADIDPEAPLPVVSALAAAWLLMQQPSLVDRATERPDKAARRAYSRQGRPEPEVTIVDLRRQYVPQDRDPDAGTDGRRYRHRWVVSGHWRTYKSARYSDELRAEGPRWIPSHVKGPGGAPLLVAEKVNVWRR